MDCSRRLFFALILAGLPLLLVLRLVGQGQPPRQILDLTKIEQIAFIKSTMEQEFPEARADQMTMLIINRSAVTIPLIEEKLEEILKSPAPSKRFIDTASEMIAYAGDEESLRAVAKLIAIDETTFARLVARTLDISSNWRNPFTVAYRSLELNSAILTRYTVAWVEVSGSSEHMQHVWARAIIQHYQHVPSDSELRLDPIVSRLPNGLPSRVKDELSTIAEANRRGR